MKNRGKTKKNLIIYCSESLGKTRYVIFLPLLYSRCYLPKYESGYNLFYPGIFSFLSAPLVVSVLTAPHPEIRPPTANVTYT